MPKKEDAYGDSEHGNWNVASDYSKLKIMKQLYLADEYANIAIFGAANLSDQNPTQVYFHNNRISGFERLVQCLILLIDNTVFAVKKGNEDLEKYKEELERINNITHLLYKIQDNRVEHTKKLFILERTYKPVLDRVLKIKSLINEPLNKADLIFTAKEEFDPKAAKEQFKKELMGKG